MKITVNTTTAYDIHLQHPQMVAAIKELPGRKIIITDHNVLSLYGYRLARELECDVIAMAAGEAHKTRMTKAKLEDELLARGFGRDTCIIALGGGVVLDLVGFVAATYCRGVSVVYVPTTLLAMVDACVGGKTGVNTPFGKNMIGTFTQPTAVFIDVEFLSTLVREEFYQGIVETIKHALIRSFELWHFMQEAQQKIVALDFDALLKMISMSVRIKANVVEQDEREESGVRELLNCGHTVGHAIEVASGYHINHGLAVASGLVQETEYGIELGVCNDDTLAKIVQMLDLYEIPFAPVGKTYPFKRIQRHFSADKKRKSDQDRFALVTAIGHSSIIVVNTANNCYLVEG